MGNNLFIEAEEEAEEQNGEPDPTPEYKEAIHPELKEIITRDCGPLLVIRLAYFAPKKVKGDAWVHNNIFLVHLHY